MILDLLKNIGELFPEIIIQKTSQQGGKDVSAPSGKRKRVFPNTKSKSLLEDPILNLSKSISAIREWLPLQ